MPDFKKVDILGVFISAISFSDAVNEIQKMADKNTPFQVTTVNLEFVMMAQKDERFKDVLNCSDLAVPDGAGVLLASKIVARRKKNPGLVMTERVTGVDLVYELCKISAEKGFKVFLLGGADGVAEAAKKKLEKKYPGIKIVGAEQGGRVSTDGKSDEDEKLIAQIAKADTDFLFVAFGAPKQDKWIANNFSQLNCVCMGIGGTFDFIIGRQKRAPKLFRKLGLEWFWRLVREPWRIKRMMALPRSLIKVLLSK